MAFVNNNSDNAFLIDLRHTFPTLAIWYIYHPYEDEYRLTFARMKPNSRIEIEGSQGWIVVDADAIDAEKEYKRIIAHLSLIA